MFKRGDKIRCVKISAGYVFEPEIGKIYVVSEASYAYATLDGRLVNWVNVERTGRWGLLTMGFYADDFVLESPRIKRNLPAWF